MSPFEDEPVGNEQERLLETVIQVNGADVLNYAKQTLADGDSGTGAIGEVTSQALTTDTLHWLFESFGDKDDKDQYHLYPYKDRDGFGGYQGEELPDAIKQLVTYVYNDELCFHGENELSGWTSSSYFEERPLVVPYWDELRDRYTSFQDVYDVMKNSQEILDGIQLPLILVTPQVNVVFEPQYHYGWGLQFKVDMRNVEATVFGQRDKTWQATNFLVDSLVDKPRMVHLVTNLGLMAVESSRQFRYWQDKPTQQSLTSLDDRLAGESTASISLQAYPGKPGEAVKTHLVSKLIAEGLIAPPQNSQ